MSGIATIAYLENVMGKTPDTGHDPSLNKRPLNTWNKAFNARWAGHLDVRYAGTNEYARDIGLCRKQGKVEHPQARNLLAGIRCKLSTSSHVVVDT